jgi:hypothetical protein
LRNLLSKVFTDSQNRLPEMGGNVKTSRFSPFLLV